MKTEWAQLRLYTPRNGPNVAEHSLDSVCSSGCTLLAMRLGLVRRCAQPRLPRHLPFVERLSSVRVCVQRCVQGGGEAAAGQPGRHVRVLALRRLHLRRVLQAQAQAQRGNGSHHDRPATQYCSLWMFYLVSLSLSLATQRTIYLIMMDGPPCILPLSLFGLTTCYGSQRIIMLAAFLRLVVIFAMWYHACWGPT